MKMRWDDGLPEKATTKSVKKWFREIDEQQRANEVRDSFIRDYNEQLEQVKRASKVYKGIRYYTFGETYFCAKKDVMCKYPFTRVCDELNDVEKYIDENFKALKNEMKIGMSDTFQALKNNTQRLEKELAIAQIELLEFHLKIYNKK